MKAFAHLLERLAFTLSRNGKMLILRQYLESTPDPERGWALAALTDTLKLRQVTPALLKTMVGARVDPVLFTLSYHFVGDLAETIALIWPEPEAADAAPQEAPVPLSAAVELLAQSGRARGAEQIASLLDRLTPSERLAFLKLATGNLRLGLSARMARLTLATMGSRDIAEIEELWHQLQPPFLGLFDWLAGGAAPVTAAIAPFRPVMLSTPVTLAEVEVLSPEAYQIEWKWDGIRVQAVSERGSRRLYSRTGDDISAAFPDLLAALDYDGCLDGELLVRRGNVLAPFAHLQRRLGRKAPSRAVQDEFPACLRIYDLLSWQGEDWRAQPLAARRAKLETLEFDSPRLDLSPRLQIADWQALAAMRAAPPDPQIEGVILKRLDSAYLAGRPRGPWFKWKREAMRLDAVLLYAQPGHGKRSGFYSDFTFGLWQDSEEGLRLVPVGKAYFGFTDEELVQIDRFVRRNTLQRFGPVRQVAAELVLEVAFEGVSRSTRHKSGLAMRFPRIARIRWDKPAAEADRLDALEALL